ncbi:MAG: hypothetical protein HUJ62_06490 [Streptococcus gallolyticus]|nr:hypothetical protein [Streptococcus gallolyticus]
MINCDLIDYLYKDFSAEEVDSDMLKFWKDRSLFAQLLDVQGEAERVREAWELHESEPSAKNEEALDKNLQQLHNVCLLCYKNPNNAPQEMWELKFSEWEMFDFCKGANTLNTSMDYIMQWFNQWAYDVNFALL